MWSSPSRWAATRLGSRSSIPLRAARGCQRSKSSWVALSCNGSSVSARCSPKVWASSWQSVRACRSGKRARLCTWRCASPKCGLAPSANMPPTKGASENCCPRPRLPASLWRLARPSAACYSALRKSRATFPRRPCFAPSGVRSLPFLPCSTSTKVASASSSCLKSATIISGNTSKCCHSCSWAP